MGKNNHEDRQSFELLRDRKGKDPIFAFLADREQESDHEDRREDAGRNNRVIDGNDHMMDLFEFRRRRRLGCPVEHDSDDFCMLGKRADDLVADRGVEIETLDRHEVFGRDGAHGERIAVDARIAFDADGFESEQSDDRLRDLFIDAVLDEDGSDFRIGFAHELEKFSSYRHADDAQEEPRAGKRLALGNDIAQSELFRHAPHFEFEEVGKRSDFFEPEIEIDIMMFFYER